MNTISQEKRQELAAQIQPLREQIDSWRANRAPNQPMPEPLWEAATALARVYGVSPVQRSLRVDYRGLEYRTLGLRKGKSAKPPPPKPTLVELSTMLPPRRTEHTVELEDGAGRKMTVKFCGGSLADLVPLTLAFWRPSV